MPRPKSTQYDFPQIDVFDDSISDALLAHHLFAALRPREIEIFARLANGRLTKLIAADLHIAKRTVDLHRHSIMRKLKLRSIAEEAVLGYRIRHQLKRWLALRATQQHCAGGSAVQELQSVY